MYSTSEKYKEVIQKDIIWDVEKLVIDGEEYTDFIKLHRKAGIVSEDHINFGNCISSFLDVEIPEISNATKFIGRKVYYYVGLHLEDYDKDETENIEWIPMGVFNIVEPDVNDQVLSFTAYDNMYYTQQGFFSDLKGSQKVSTVLNEQCKKIGITYAGGDSGESINVDLLQGLELRDALGYIASYCGKNAIINRQGNLQLKWFEEIDVTIPPDRCSDTFNVAPKDTTIGRLVCAVSKEQTFTHGSEVASAISFSNPLMTEAQIKVLFDKVNGFTYRAINFNAIIGRPEIDVGDIIKVQDLDGTIYHVPVFIMENDGFNQTIQANAKTEEQEKFEFQGSVSKAIENTYSEIVSAKKVMADTVIAFDGKFQTLDTDILNVNKKIKAHEGQFETIDSDIAKLKQADIDNLTAVNGRIDNLVATDLTSVNAKINNLEVDVENVNTLLAGTVTSGSTQTIVLNAQNTTIANALIKSAMIESLSFDKITGIDVNTTKLTVHSADGKSTWKDNTIQISDTNRVRVQVGKDASGDYNMYVWDKSGNLMFDATGITAKGIQRPIIVNDMVSDNANISGDKINITSVIQKINANTTLIESSHILYDGKSLDVAFGTMETSISNVTTNVNTVTKTVTDNKGKWDTASTNATNALNTANTVTKTVSDNKANWDKAPTALTNANNAQNTANNAQSLANSKAKVFSAQPTPPYQVGDLWVQGTSGVIMRCKTARASGTYTASDWEKADKYTDDTKAIAVETKVTTVTETVKSHSTQLTAQDGKISTLISDTAQVKKDITAVQGDVTTAKGNITTLQTNYSALDQTVKGLTSTVGEHTSKITTVTNTVNNNKANWDKAPTALDNANKAQSTANTAKSTADSAKTTAGNAQTAANNANTKIDGLELGGINLLIVKNITKGKYLNNSGSEVSDSSWFYSNYIPVKGLKNLVASGYSNLGISPSVCYYDKDKKFVKGINNNSQSLGRLMTIDSGIEYIRFSGMIVDLPTLKIEKGTKPTNYSPAPEDVDASINTVNTRITTEIKTVSDKYATLQQDVNGFKTTVSSTYSTKTEVSKVKNDAATDATNKANQAKTDAINSANANTSTLLKSYSTTSAMNSAITQKASEITTAVSNTYTTKADFNALAIGGRNLLRKSAITSANLSFWNKTDATVTLVTEDGFNCYKIVSTGNSGIQGSGGVVTGNILIPNVRYTYSFWCKSSIDKAVNHNSIMHFQTINGSVVHNNANLQLKVTSIKANTWTKLAISFNVTKQCYFVPFIWYLGSATYFVRDIMVEEGSRDGAWTPAPEDIDASIATVDGKFKNYSTTTQMNSAITTKANEITSNVSKTYATQATVNTINGDVSALKTRVNTAESKITDTAIVNTVRDSTSYKNDLTGKVGKTEIISCINQTAETIKISASKIDLVGKVTISMLDSTTQTKVNNGDNAMSSINTNKANWDKGKTAYDWTNTNGGNMTNLRNMVLKWTNNAVSTSTYIQGGWIATNTITSAQIATGTIVIGDLDSGVQTKLNTGYDNAYKAYWMSMALSQGQSMYNDPAFLRGTNGLKVYNNSSNGAVTITREAKASGWSYDTPYRIKVTSNGTTTPGHGGVHWGFTPKAGHTYLFKLIAMIPSGRNIAWATNSMGDGATQEWLTPVAGTNTWTEYVCKIKAGTGSISTTGFFYIVNGATGFSWYIVYANVFDLGSENLISTFTKGTTEIYGDYIKTGTITANHIRGNKLEGTEIVGGKISSNTTIDVTTDLTVGDNIHVGTNAGRNKYIYLNSNTYIQRMEFNGGDYLKLQSGKRVSLLAYNPTYGETVNVSAWIDSGVNRIELGANEVRIQGNLNNNTGIEVMNANSASDGELAIGYGFRSYGKRTTIYGKEVRFATDKATLMWWYDTNNTYSGYFASNKSGTSTLGTTTYLWRRVYASMSEYIPSDIRLKQNIKEYDERFEKMFMDLKPVTYELKSNPIKRQCGMIAQWVQEAMIKNGINEREFGVFEHNAEEDTFGLVYPQMTSLNTHMIQKTIKAVDTQGVVLKSHEQVISEVDRKSKENEYKIEQLKKQLDEERQLRIKAEQKLNAIISGEIKVESRVA